MIQSKLLAFLFILLPVFAEATLQGKLDLGALPEPIGVRELHDGNWLAGLNTPVWHLERNGGEVFHAGFFTAWRAMQGDPAYGPSLGIPIGSVGNILANTAAIVAPSMTNIILPPWVTQLGNWVSLDVYGGYRPVHGGDTHSWIYGVGGKVRIPIDLIKGL